MKDGSIIVESTETLALRAIAGGYEARIVYNPCDYLKSYAPSSQSEIHEGQYTI